MNFRRATRRRFTAILAASRWRNGIVADACPCPIRRRTFRQEAQRALMGKHQQDPWWDIANGPVEGVVKRAGLPVALRTEKKKRSVLILQLVIGCRLGNRSASRIEEARVSLIQMDPGRVGREG